MTYFLINRSKATPNAIRVIAPTMAPIITPMLDEGGGLAGTFISVTGGGVGGGAKINLQVFFI